HGGGCRGPSGRRTGRQGPGYLCPNLSLAHFLLRSDALVTTVEATHRAAVAGGPAGLPASGHAWHREGKPADRCTGNPVAAAPPAGLGLGVTHPSITTDYSEALVELITPVTGDIDELFGELDRIHRFVYSELGDELLWTESMP